jgi:hypothetical protein
MGLGSEIGNPEKTRGQKVTGSRILIRNTDYDTGYRVRAEGVGRLKANSESF